MKRTNCLLAVVTAVSLVGAARAAILEEFRFEDADGTNLASAVNSANPGNNWVEDTDHVPSIQVLGGSLSIVKNDTNFVTEGLGLADVSSGTLWMVAEFKDWAILGSAPDGNNVEEIRFGFMGTEDLTPPPSSTVLAEMQLRRNFSAGTFEVFGTALGSAGTNLTPAAVSFVQNDPFNLVMKVDQDSDTYEVFYKDGANPYVSIGVGNLEPTRDAIIVRFTINNFIGDEMGEFVNLDRFYVTNTNPIPEPSAGLLALLALWGLLGKRRV